MRVYICGKMTGLPDYNRPKFNQMAERLTNIGIKVYNPAGIEDYLKSTLYLKRTVNNHLVSMMNDIFPGVQLNNEKESELTWSDYMREALKMMLECDVVCVLDGFETSRGANIEINLAKELGMTIISEKYMIRFIQKLEEERTRTVSEKYIKKRGM